MVIYKSARRMKVTMTIIGISDDRKIYLSRVFYLFFSLLGSRAGPRFTSKKSKKRARASWSRSERARDGMNLYIFGRRPPHPRRRSRSYHHQRCMPASIGAETCVAERGITTDDNSISNTPTERRKVRARALHNYLMERVSGKDGGRKRKRARRE